MSSILRIGHRGVAVCIITHDHHTATVFLKVLFRKAKAAWEG